MPKKDAVCAKAALKEALSMCEDRNLHQIKGSRIILSSTPAILQWFCRENGRSTQYYTTVRRMLKQAHLGREWWSYACRFAGHMMREKVLGRDWPYPLFGQ